LRIFQFLRNYQSRIKKSDEDCLSDFFAQYYPHEHNYFFKNEQIFSFSTTSIQQLDELRNFLAEKEKGYQQEFDFAL